MALRAYWTKDRAKLLIRGDSVSMLTMVLCPKPSRSPGLGLLARELALDLVEGAFKPDIAAVHIGGVTNKLADLLSREAAPGGTGVRPLVLQPSSETVILPRPRSWYRTLRPLSLVIHGSGEILKKGNTRSRDCMCKSPKLWLLSFDLGRDLLTSELM